MKTENYETTPSGKPLQFRPDSSQRRGCCPKAQLLMDIAAQSDNHLITRDTPAGTCQTSPNIQSTRKSSNWSSSNQKLPPTASPMLTRTRSASPDQASKQWQFVSRLLLFAFLIIFMAAWSYMLCSMDNECRPFSDNSKTGNGSLFWIWPEVESTIIFPWKHDRKWRRPLFFPWKHGRAADLEFFRKQFFSDTGNGSLFWILSGSGDDRYFFLENAVKAQQTSNFLNMIFLQRNTIKWLLLAFLQI